MGFSSNLKSGALFPRRDGSRSTHKWALNSCSSSNELGARYVQPHQKPRRPYLQEEDMPDASKYVNNHPNAIWCCLFEKKLWLFCQSCLGKGQCTEVSQGQQGRQDKKADERQGQLFHNTEANY